MTNFEANYYNDIHYNLPKIASSLEGIASSLQKANINANIEEIKKGVKKEISCPSTNFDEFCENLERHLARDEHKLFLEMYNEIQNKNINTNERLSHLEFKCYELAIKTEFVEQILGEVIPEEEIQNLYKYNDPLNVLWEKYLATEGSDIGSVVNYSIYATIDNSKLQKKDKPTKENLDTDRE